MFYKDGVFLYRVPFKNIAVTRNIQDARWGWPFLGFILIDKYDGFLDLIGHIYGSGLFFKL